jgi:glycosyl hydrolase family 2
MPDDDNAPRRVPMSRAGFLKGLGAIGLAAAAGPAVAATRADARPTGVRQPVETGWQPQQPPLTTPWTGEVGPDNALPEYPRPQLTRPDWLSLNGVWQFAAAAEGDPPPVGTELAERILVPYPVESALSGIMRHESRMYYRRRFVVPPGWRIGRGNRLLLHLDAVDYAANVWVNGTEVGSHRGGYDRLSIDVTDALDTGTEQELIVGAYDPTEDGVQPLGKQRVGALSPGENVIYYTPASGIWQSVWLEPVPALHIRSLQLVPHLSDGSLEVTAAVGSPVRVRATAYAGGRIAGTATGTADRPLRVPVAGARPWTPDDPFLYELVVEVVGGDRVGSYFGMREVAVREVAGAPHIVLNGRFVFQLSTLQQGFWPDGIYTPATDAAMVFDVARNKSLGFNTIRKHQKVEPDRWYFHADRLGQLVWQDMPATATGVQPPDVTDPTPQPPVDGQREFVAELRRIVAQHHNHPSIVMWIPFNEGWGEFDIARIAALVKEWDPTRIVDEMSGANTAALDAGGGEVLDYHNIGFTPPSPVPSTADGRVAVIGEFGAYGLVIDGHVWDPARTASPAPVPDAATLNDDYVAIMAAVASYAGTESLSAANYNLFEDVEHQVNGLYTYDRKVLKVDPARARAANLAVLVAGEALNGSDA